jgi:hypothetical protein
LTGSSFKSEPTSDALTYYLTTFDTLARGKLTDYETTVIKGAGITFASDANTARVTFPSPLSAVPVLIQVSAASVFTNGTNSYIINLFLFTATSDITKEGFTVTRDGGEISGELTGSVNYTIIAPGAI